MKKCLADYNKLASLNNKRTNLTEVEVIGE